MREMLRPAVFIPESKPLNVLLKEFRKNRNHIAIVVDEYGGVAGLRHDRGRARADRRRDRGRVRFRRDRRQHRPGQAPATTASRRSTEIADFNEKFGTTFSDDEFDTVGGLVLKRFGRVPKRGEQVTMEGLTFKVLRADSRRLHLLEVEARSSAEA